MVIFSWCMIPIEFKLDNWHINSFRKWVPRNFKWVPQWIPFFNQKTCQSCQMTESPFLIKLREVSISLTYSQKKRPYKM